MYFLFFFKKKKKYSRTVPLSAELLISASPHIVCQTEELRGTAGLAFRDSTFPTLVNGYSRSNFASQL